MDWQITLTGQLEAPLSETQLLSAAESLGKFEAAIAVGTPDEPNRFEVTLTLYDCSQPSDAMAAASDMVGSAVGWPRWVGGEAITVEEADRRLREPTIPELVSGVEAAEILGVSRQRVHQLAADNSLFPPPVARLASGSVWLRVAVESFAEKWERKPGRPRRRPEFTDNQRQAIVSQGERSQRLFSRADTELSGWFCANHFHPAKAHYIEALDAPGFFRVQTLKCSVCDWIAFVTGSPAVPD